MSFLDSIKKGLFDQEDDYEDQYIDDGPQMVNNNNGVGLGADDEAEEHTEGTNKKNGKVVNINATLPFFLAPSTGSSFSSSAPRPMPLLLFTIWGPSSMY